MHKLIRRLDDELLPTGVPRTKPAVAAVRAAGWAVTRSPGGLAPAHARAAATDHAAALNWRRPRVWAADGVRSSGRGRATSLSASSHCGELDFARLCRARAPEPSRQAVGGGRAAGSTSTSGGTAMGCVVEIDGAQHREGLNVSIDNLGRNELSSRGQGAAHRPDRSAPARGGLHGPGDARSGGHSVEVDSSGHLATDHLHPGAGLVVRGALSRGARRDTSNRGRGRGGWTVGRGCPGPPVGCGA